MHLIPQNETIPRKLQFILRKTNDHSGEIQFVPFFWHVERTGASFIHQICDQAYELRLKPSSVLKTKKQIDIFHRRMSGLSATAQEFWDAEKDCKEYARKLDEASAFGVNPTTWTYKDIDECIPIKAMILREHKCLPTCFHYLQTPEIYEAAKLYSINNRKARVATVLRDPIDRFISLFNYLKTATWDTSFNPTKLTLNDFILTGEYKKSEWAGNWMTCKLAQCRKSFTDSASDIKLNIAKNVLRNVLVGFTDNMKEFIERLENYWQTPAQSRENAKEFIKSFNVKGKVNTTSSSILSEEAKSILQNHLSYDIQLYEYAKETLWHEQIQWLVDP